MIICLSFSNFVKMKKYLFNPEILWTRSSTALKISTRLLTFCEWKTIAGECGAALWGGESPSPSIRPGEKRDGRIITERGTSP